MTDLSSAIENRLAIDKSEAKIYAGMLMDIFGFHDRIIDNVLEHEERQLFYLLESEGILNTGREEIILHDGRVWRIHYWILKKKNIIEFSKGNIESEKFDSIESEEIQHENIYDYLPKKMWTARKL